MTRQATKTPSARKDLVEIAVYVGQEDPDVAGRFLDAAEGAFAKLAQFPGMGPRRDLRNPKYATLRFWVIKGFGITSFITSRRGGGFEC
jgi:plasmid stabilization system protein ParE